MDISDIEQLTQITKSLNRIYEEVETLKEQEEDSFYSLPDDEQHYLWRDIAFENVEDLNSVLEELDVIIDKIHQIKQNNE